nr:putative RNA-directed DNA polymerase [Tanacetum cinerariifolium]
MNMELVLMAKAFKLNYLTPTNNNKRISSNLRNRKIAQPGMNMGQDRQMQMVRGNGGNQYRHKHRHRVLRLTKLLSMTQTDQLRGDTATCLREFPKMKQLNKEIKPINYTKINHLLGVFVSLTAKSREELHFSDTSKTANVSKPISIPNEKFSDDTTPSVARKFLNEDTTQGTSVNTQFCKQSILGQPPSSSKPKLYVVTPLPKSKSLPKIDETHVLSKPVTLNSVPTPQKSKVVKNNNVITPEMFRINHFKPSREVKSVPNKVRESVKTKLITVSQPHVITKKDVNSNSNGFSYTIVDKTAKTKRPQPRSNTKNDRVSSVSKSSCNKNKEVKVEEYPRNLLLSKNKKHMSSKCNNVKLAIRNDKSKVVCTMCKQCLITANHDVRVINYVNDINSRAIATACYTQNRSIIHRRFNKTPYELINGKKPNISFLHVSEALCYPKNYREYIGKLGEKGDIGLFIYYSADSCAYRVYNQRTKKIMETMNVTFDELLAMAFEQSSSKPGFTKFQS